MILYHVGSTFCFLKNLWGFPDRKILEQFLRSNRGHECLNAHWQKGLETSTQEHQESPYAYMWKTKSLRFVAQGSIEGSSVAFEPQSPLLTPLYRYLRFGKVSDGKCTSLHSCKIQTYLLVLRLRGWYWWQSDLYWPLMMDEHMPHLPAIRWRIRCQIRLGSV